MIFEEEEDEEEERKEKSYWTFNVCFDFLCNFETFLIIQTEHDLIKMYNGLHVKYLLFLSDFT
jgi:hypothetical protein